MCVCVCVCAPCGTQMQDRGTRIHQLEDLGGANGGSIPNGGFAIWVARRHPIWDAYIRSVVAASCGSLPLAVTTFCLVASSDMLGNGEEQGSTQQQGLGSGVTRVTRVYGQGCGFTV